MVKWPELTRRFPIYIDLVEKNHRVRMLYEWEGGSARFSGVNAHTQIVIDILTAHEEVGNDFNQ